LTRPADRDAINAVFGVHVMLVSVHSDEQGAFFDAERLVAIDAAMQGLSHASIKCTVTPSSFLYYANRARGGLGSTVDLHQGQADELGLLKSVVPRAIPTTPDGRETYVEVYTTAADEAYQELGMQVVRALEAIPGVKLGPRPAAALAPGSSER
jgi:hypothetical protein